MTLTTPFLALSPHFDPILLENYLNAITFSSTVFINISPQFALQRSTPPYLGSLSYSPCILSSLFTRGFLATFNSFSFQELTMFFLESSLRSVDTLIKTITYFYVIASQNLEPFGYRIWTRQLTATTGKS